jgi:penicillin V acylase-like amidase (Ntn superfamily)
MKRIIHVLNVLGCWLFAAATAFPCTTFVLKGDGQIYFGRNLDWDWEEGLVVVNPRGIKKTALVAQGNSPAIWTSKYGSVTFNQFGQEEPYGGMNEAGLEVEQMMLFESQYPAADSRPEIDMLQWIQYQLDTCSNVAEVVATDRKIRLERPTVPARIHYMVCDATGDGTTIEFLGGKMVCHRGQTLPYRALANSTYEQSVAYARTNPVPAGFSERLEDPQSLPRFTCAASRAAGFQPRTPEKDVAYAFETLEQVRQGKATVWQIVYDVSARRIHYRTASNPQRRTLELKSLDFAQARAARFVDIRANPSLVGTLEFADLTEARHRRYLETFCAQPSLKQAMGDLTPMIELQLLRLRSYTHVKRQP